RFAAYRHGLHPRHLAASAVNRYTIPLTARHSPCILRHRLRGHSTLKPRNNVNMYVDSHCHLDFPELAQNLPDILSRMAQNQVSHALVVSVNLPDWPRLIELVATQSNL